ncbi:glycosyltransferase [Sphingobacterium sp. HMA12]|uniref:glycosyltransferase n=1 Tax=Sphingobacterium sp. HMA12 TaxID=2050894 RepID=UPI000CE9EAE0|nr:glycosyltransferase [Sphingobacterium sp. HMA12]
MKKKKYLVLGYFGYKNNQIDGQTIKTREVYELLCEKKDSKNVSYFDTQILQTSRLAIFNLLYQLVQADTIIYLPGQNNLKSFFPIVSFISEFLKKNIIYCVVGGWLVDFLKENKSIAEKLNICSAILVETDYLKTNLATQFNLNNVYLFPNFRRQSFKPDFDKALSNTFNLVFMARIMEEKGINYIFNFADYILETDLQNSSRIHFYGQINEKDLKVFLEKVQRYPFVEYKGVVEPSNVYSTLTNYDLLLLPTYYEGEGFPGTIIDAYISGVPVLASRWKQIPEFIDVGQTGFLFDLNNQREFNDIIIELLKHKDTLVEMKKQAFIKSMNYSADSAWKILEPFCA